MEDNQKQSETRSLDLQQGSGAMLAAARKQQSKTIEEVADKLNLSLTQIKTIELDQTDGLPEPTYVRGYIRAYAKLLGLNPDEVLQNYLNPNWQQGSSLNDIPRGIGSSTEESDRRFWTPFKSVLLLLLIAALGYFWYSGALSDRFGSNSVTSTNSPQAISSEVETSPAAPTNIQLDRDLDEEPLENLDQESNEGIAVEEPITANSISENQLEMTFSKATWIDIKDESGTRLAYKTYAAGESLDVSSKLPLSVFIGEAENVSVEYNGSPFDLSDHIQGVYAKFVVGAVE